MKITYKNVLASPKPYRTCSTDSFIKQLRKKHLQIHTGINGIYLSRGIVAGSQDLYFLFIDIDGDAQLQGDRKIESSIINAKLTYDSLHQLGAHEYFDFIATGGTGLRAVSNVLVSHDHYRGFTELVRHEMAHIIDIKPTVDIEMPHQMLAYKNHECQTNKKPVDRHSTEVPRKVIEHNKLTVEHYKSITSGRPDPDEYIRFMERFFRFRVIADIKSLGVFGQRISEYSEFTEGLKKNVFSLSKWSDSSNSLSLDVVSKLLTEKGKEHKVEKRGKAQAISFRNKKCPVCGKKSANAYAYAPSYWLHCHDTNCEAHKGMPFSEWSGIILPDSRSKHQKTSSENQELLPFDYDLLNEVPKKIIKELSHNGDVLMSYPAGTAKSYETRQHYVRQAAEKLIIYSSYNTALQQEAYKHALDYAREIGTSTSDIHIIQARDKLCPKSSELKRITAAGYSPSEMLCSRCEHRRNDTCKYYAERDNITTGLYFVTHQMLQYLQKRFPEPDVLVLDEDVIKGFLLVDSCSANDIKTLLIEFQPLEQLIIYKILSIAERLSSEVVKEQYPFTYHINADNPPGADSCENTIVSILARQYSISKAAMKMKIKSAVLYLEKISRTQLYKNGINLKALKWLQGIVSHDIHSFIAIAPSGNIEFKTKQLTPIGYKNTPIKILDATGNKQAAECITRRKFSVATSNVLWHSKRYHIKICTSRKAVEFSKDKSLKRLLGMALTNITADKILLITYESKKETVLNIAQGLAPDKTFMNYHFFGPRGINTYSECDAVIVLGLPYPNMDSSYHDAQILFRGSNDADDKINPNDWFIDCMEAELTQNIHRIRPIRKAETQIVIIVDQWPQCLPEPPDENIIDLSNEKDWKQNAIERLDPFVRQLGFLNPDVGYLANVYTTTKTVPAHKFRNKLSNVINAESAVNDCTRQMGGDQQHITYNHIRKLFKDIYNIYIFKTLRILNEMFPLFRTLFVFDVDEAVELSSPYQWTEILSAFKNRYPYFDEFKIKLPHSRNNFVNGIGIESRVKQFYEGLSKLKLFGNVDINSYRLRNKSSIKINPIPDGFVVVCISEQNPEYIYIGRGNAINTLMLTSDWQAAVDYVSAIDSSVTIITNNGKAFAKLFLQNCIARRDIYDVGLNERLIRNGEVLPDMLTNDYLFKQYNLSEHVEMVMSASQLYTVWEKQQALITNYKLNDIVTLEMLVLWVVVEMELTGIGIDLEAMDAYQQSIKDKLDDDDSLKYDNDMIDYCLEHCGDDDRIHENIDQLGTVSGRFQRRLQGVRRDGPMRTFFWARDGYKFIIADYAQEEPRVLAALSNCERYRKVFVEGGDIYTDLMRALSQECSIEYRKVFKQIVQILHYGSSGYSIKGEFEKLKIYITRNEAETLYNDYSRKYNDVFQWKQKTLKDARNNGLMITKMGRRMTVKDDTKDGSIYNFPVQANAADGFKKAIVMVHDKLQGIDAQIVHTLHDEIIVEASDETVEDVLGIVKRCMEKVFQDMFPDIPFVVEPNVREAWGLSLDSVSKFIRLS